MPLSKLALQFSSQNPAFPTTLFSSTRRESVRRNVAWHEEMLDTGLLADVRLLLAPVMNKQWDYDSAVERLKEVGRSPVHKLVAAADGLQAPPVSLQTPADRINPV